MTGMRSYINFADCAYNFKTGQIVRERRTMGFLYALSIPYPGKRKPTGAFGKFVTKIFKKDKHTNAGMGGRSGKRLEMFQSLAGNDKISVKCRDGVYHNIRNRCLMVFATSSLPDIQDIQMIENLSERMIIFPFKNVLDREDWKMDVWKEAFEDTAGIVKFALRGIKDLEEDHFVFTESEAMMLAKDDFFGNLESFSVFAKRYLKYSKDHELASETINKAYTAYCLKHEFPILYYNQWAVLLKKRFRCSEGVYCFEGRKSRGYRGIDLTEEGYELLSEDTELEEDFNDPIQTAIRKRMELEAAEDP